MASDKAQSGDEPWHKRLSLILSLAALVISVPLAAANALFLLLGSEIVVLKPKSAALYRDGGRGGAVLSIAVPVFMINSSTTRSDVMVDAELQIRKGSPVFPYENQATPVQTDQTSGRSCELRAHCIPLDGLLVVENNEVVDIPPGGARSTHLSFAVIGSGYGDFDSAAAALDGAPLDLTIKLRLHGDGVREIRCRTGTVNSSYLSRFGFNMLPCVDSHVSEPPFF